jgi:hypothetical protein
MVARAGGNHFSRTLGPRHRSSIRSGTKSPYGIRSWKCLSRSCGPRLFARNPGQREAAGAKSTSSREGLGGCHLTTSTDAQNQSKSWDRRKSREHRSKSERHSNRERHSSKSERRSNTRENPIIGAAVSTSVCPPMNSAVTPISNGLRLIDAQLYPTRRYLR